MRFRICPDCGCSLDPQEICDCSRADTEKAAPDATNIQSGRVDQYCNTDPLPILLMKLEEIKSE